MTLDRDPLRYPVNDADADGDADADVGLDRDQVVALLKRDAQDRAERYTTDGVSAMIPSSRPKNCLRPNTRFLHRLVHAADSHNQALLEREARDAREKFRSLSRPEGRDRSGYRLGERFDQARRRRERERERDGGDVEEKRRGESDRTRDRDRDGRREDSIERPSDRAAGGGRDRAEAVERRSSRRRSERTTRSHRSRHDDDDDHDDDGIEAEKNRRKKPRRRSRSRSRSPTDSEDVHDRDRPRKRRSKRDDRDRDRSRSRSRSRSPNRDRKRDSKSSRRAGSSERKCSRRSSGGEKQPAMADLPPRPSSVLNRDTTARVVTRGVSNPTKGVLHSRTAPSRPIPTPTPASKSVSAPVSIPSSTKTQPYLNLNGGNGGSNGTDGVDFDPAAVAAYRSRMEWRRIATDRVVQAGYSDAQVRAWSATGDVNHPSGLSVDDIRWTPRGQVREWDRGKVVTDHGVVVVGPDWARPAPSSSSS